MSKGTFTATGTFTTSGGGRGHLVAGAVVVVVLVLEWLAAHAVVLLAVTGGIGVTGAGLYVLAVRYHERRGVIVAAGFAELHDRQREQLPPVQQPGQLAAGVHLHLAGPEAVELARQLIDGQRPPIPARIATIHAIPGQAGTPSPKGNDER